VTVKCPQCGNIISYEAVACTKCAYPAKRFEKIYYSSIEIIAEERMGLNNLCCVYDTNYKKLAQSRSGEKLVFKCTEPMTVLIEIFGCICRPEINVLPGESYWVRLKYLGKILIEKI